MFSGGDMEIRSNLALAYDKLGDFEHAIKQFNAIVHRNPKDPKAYFLLAKVYAEDKQYGEAIKTLKQAHQLNSSDVKDLLEIGDLIYQHGKFNFAKDVYEMALETKKEIAKIHNKIGLCYKGLGLKEEAEKEFKKSLEADRKEQDLKKNPKTLEADSQRKT